MTSLFTSKDQYELFEPTIMMCAQESSLITGKHTVKPFNSFRISVMTALLFSKGSVSLISVTITLL